MAIKRKHQTFKKREIDITGPEGNAYVLMGYAQNLAKQLDLDHKSILAEMESGDYENLIRTFDKYFGDYVDLVR